MNNSKINEIISAIIIIVIGVLIATLGINTVLNNYVAIVCIIIGGLLALGCLAAIIKKAPLTIGIPVFSGILLAVGITIFTKWLDLAALINLLVSTEIGFGAGLALYGCYLVCFKKQLAMGLTQFLSGAIALLLGILYIAIPDFRTVFWIIVGILIAVYGGISFVIALAKKD